MSEPPPALKVPSAELRKQVQALAEAQLPQEEFLRRLRAPLSEEEIAEILDLVRWFTRRYPTPLERIRYVGEAYRRWLKTNQEIWRHADQARAK